MSSPDLIERADYIRAVVDQLPPLDDEQRATVAALMRPDVEAPA